MRKFISQCIKGEFYIFQCEVSAIKPRPHTLSSHEELYEVNLPSQFKGEKWYSFFFQESLDDYKRILCEDLKQEMIRNSIKRKEIFSEEELNRKISLIQIKLL